MDDSTLIFLGLVLLILSIWIDYLVAKEFCVAAKLKGYSEKKYFWICFLLGLVGYLLIIALPDRGDNQRIANDELPEL